MHVQASPAQRIDADFYHTHGWVAVDQLLTSVEIESALAGVAAYHAGHRDRSLDLQIKKFLDWSPESVHELRVNDYVALQSAQIAQVALKPALGRVAARLTGSSQIRLFNSSLIYKPPGIETEAVKIGWHTDRAYWQTCTSDDMLTAWIPLHDMHESMGPVTMLDGSHRWGDSAATSELRRSKSFICDDVATLEHRLRAVGERFTPVPMTLRAGQVSFHHCRTFHGSGPNTSTRPRISLIVHMQDMSNRYRRRTDPDGNPYVHTLDHLVRRLPDGSPDYADPDICPVIWDESQDAGAGDDATDMVGQAAEPGR